MVLVTLRAHDWQCFNGTLRPLVDEPVDSFLWQAHGHCAVPKPSLPAPPLNTTLIPTRHINCTVLAVALERSIDNITVLTPPSIKAVAGSATSQHQHNSLASQSSVHPSVQPTEANDNLMMGK